MSSSQSDAIQALLDKTEANLKRIEQIDDAFSCFVLNEWRYATRHMADYMRTGDEEAGRKAASHLKRAYFDSCDVLLDSLLARVAEYEQAFRGYAEVVAGIVPGFREGYRCVHAAREAHLQARGYENGEREAAYDRLEPHCAGLLAFVGQLETTKNLWLDDIRRRKAGARWQTLLAVLGILATVAVGILGLRGC